MVFRYRLLWLVPALCLATGLVLSGRSESLPTPTLPPVEVTVPGCEWGGPYPGLVEGTEMWIVICAKGEGDG